jgi:hypothetical protein
MELEDEEQQTAAPVNIYAQMEEEDQAKKEQLDAEAAEAAKGTPIADALESAANLPSAALGRLVEGAENFTTQATEDANTSNPISTAASIIRPVLGVGEEITKVGMDVWKATWGQHPAIDNDIVAGGLDAIGNSSLAKAAMEALGKGVEAWDAWAKKNPVNAQILKDTGVVAEVFAPKVKIPGKHEKNVRKWQRKGNTQDITERKDGIQKLVEPDTRVGEGTTTEEGLLRRKTYEPSPHEDSIIEAMSLVDEVDPKRSFVHNNQVVLEEARKLQKDTKKAIVKSGNPSIDKDAVLGEITETIADMDQIPGYHSLSGDAKKYAEDYYKEIEQLLQNTKGSRATQILEVRQKFDKYVEAGAKVYDPHKESAKQVAARNIRNILNQAVMDAVPGDDVYDLLQRQHLLLSGADIMSSKVAKEANNVITQSVNKLRELGNLPTTPLALFATGAAVVPFAPVIGGTAATAATGYMAWRTLSKGQRKREIASLIRAMDKSNADFSAERIYLLELMKSTDEEEQ